MPNIARYLVLPTSTSPFETDYLRKVNRVALVFFALHVPALVLLAYANGTRPGLALALSLIAVAGPAVAAAALGSPRQVSVVHGVAAMMFGALLVHFGQGPLQIEMHFYFFALIAMLAVFGNPLVIWAAALTVAVHHVALWLLAPSSVFNYAAPFWVVGVHAAFVAFESAAACYIARTFFDNVIGLERIVQSRTRELDQRNRDMRMVLDNVGDGFVTVDAEGRLSAERSRAFDEWFGPSAGTLFEAIATRSSSVADELRLGWEALAENVLPSELLLDQLPKQLVAGKSSYSLSYLPIGSCDPPTRILVVVTDVTAVRSRERSEGERREVLQLFDRLLADRTIVESYYREASCLVDVISEASGELVNIQRALHTLKGNSALFGLDSIASLCHALESRIVDPGAPPTVADLGPLLERWASMSTTIKPLLELSRESIRVSAGELLELEREAQEGPPELLRRVRALRLEPTAARLNCFGDEARRLALRMGKEVDVVVTDHGLRVDPASWRAFWGSLVHAARNAIDHGIECPEVRLSSSKPRRGRLSLTTALADGRFLVEVEDDGRGIDWALLCARATEAKGAGIAPSEALFLDGVSTARGVTEISGRGIGMGALRQATRDLGGEIVVESEPQLGTRVSMWFPMSAMSPDLPAPLPAPARSPYLEPGRPGASRVAGIGS